MLGDMKELRRYLRTSGLSQSEFAGRCGITRQEVCDMLAGRIRLGWARAKKLEVGSDGRLKAFRLLEDQGGVLIVRRKR